ncbi:MAG TPA: hypothetical protein GX717_09215, partial [Clostridiaceae bacterium]|nr:hypothetical protein [Clostridiaceae bacterium]
MKRIITTLRIIFACICAACFTVFLLPLLWDNILNIGNVTGLIVFGLLTLFLLIPNSCRCIIKDWMRSGLGKWVTRFATLIVAVILGLTLVISIRMIQTNLNGPPEHATVVVLGCQVRGSTPSLMLRERLDTAYEYLQDHPDVTCILTGSKGDTGDISEAEC